MTLAEKNNNNAGMANWKNHFVLNAAGFVRIVL